MCVMICVYTQNEYMCIYTYEQMFTKFYPGDSDKPNDQQVHLVSSVVPHSGQKQ